MKLFLALLIGCCLAGLWGYLQPFIFPVGQFGIICYLSSMIGGIFIGYFCVKIFLKYFDE